MKKRNKTLVRIGKMMGNLVGIWWPDDYIRVGRKASDPTMKGLKKAYYKLLHRKLSCKMAISIPNFANIGEGFMLAHPSAIAIQEGVKIGKNCLVF